MVFKFCRYCEKIEGDMNTMSFHINNNGKTVYEDIHYLCKEKEISEPKKEELKPKIIKKFVGLKCKFCGCFENDESKLYVYINKNNKKYVRDIHLTCKEERDKQTKERHYAKSILIKKGYDKERRIKKNIVDRLNETPERKICNSCKEDKHISEFYQKRNMSYYGHCKKCQNIKTKKWSNENKEQVKNYQKYYYKMYFKENKDKIYTQNKRRKLKKISKQIINH